MQAKHFTRREAKERVGTHVQALADCRSVRKGTLGVVTKARARRGEWGVRVEWDVPTKSSVIDLMVGDASLHLHRKSKKPTDEFSKDEYETLPGTRNPA